MIKHIDTAPVIESFEQAKRCPICDLFAKTEESYIDAFLGGSVMEPDVRIVINELGFCATHWRMLYDSGNRLGVALMAHTHLIEQIQRLKDETPQKRGFFNKKTAGSAARRDSSCACCDKLSITMERYFDTVIYLYEKNASFGKLIDSSSALCVPHYKKLVQHAANLGKQEFIARVRSSELTKLAKLEADLHWFTLKFDYRNADKPWGDSKDALVRAIAVEGGCEMKDSGV